MVVGIYSRLRCMFITKIARLHALPGLPLIQHLCVGCVYAGGSWVWCSGACQAAWAAPGELGARGLAMGRVKLTWPPTSAELASLLRFPSLSHLLASNQSCFCHRGSLECCRGLSHLADHLSEPLTEAAVPAANACLPQPGAWHVFSCDAG
jgi:hypothetical protein